MPRIQPSHLGKVLYEITAGLSDKQASEKIKEFAAFLQKRRLLKYLPKVIQQYRLAYNTKESAADVTLTGAEKLNSTAKDHIEKQLVKELGFNEVTLSTQQDPAVLGGFKIKVDDLVVDDTVRGKINQLRDYLISNI